MWGDDYLIGSREQLLYAKGDRFGDPSLNIVNTIKHIAENICINYERKDIVYVIYGETYGGNVTAASKHYTNDKTYSYRLFDVVMIPADHLENILNQPVGDISIWRENNGQKFFNVDDLIDFSSKFNIDIVPYLDIVTGQDIPVSLLNVYNWMQKYSTTTAGINHTGQSEGIVVRVNDRSLIRKIRFEDYEKTKRRNGLG